MDHTTNSPGLSRGKASKGLNKHGEKKGTKPCEALKQDARGIHLNKGGPEGGKKHRAGEWKWYDILAKTPTDSRGKDI